MSLRRMFGCVCLLVLVITVHPAVVRAEDAPAGDPEAFEKGLERLFEFYEDDRCEKGLAELKTLLAAHANQPYARGRRAELEDLARRLAFRAQAKIPEPESLISGRLVKWNGRTGKIKVVYTPASAKDLERSKSGFIWFPMEVRGACTIEIEGKRYPATTEQSPRMILSCGYSDKAECEQSWQVMFGTPPYPDGGSDVWLPASITRYDGDEKVKVAEKEISPAKRGSPYKLRLSIRKTSLEARVNNKPIGKARKAADAWGLVGFECLGWQEVTLTGEIEPSWVQSKVDEALGEQREAFDKSYDRSTYLPDWLFAALPDSKRKDEEYPGQALEEEVDRVHARELRQMFVAFAADDLPGALAAVKQMRADGAPEYICLYLEARVLGGLGSPEKALEAIQACLAKETKFIDGHIFHAALLRQFGRSAESAQAYEAAIAIDPKSAYPYESAAQWMMIAGELEQARRFSRLAARNGVLSKRLDVLGGAIVKSDRGPNWPRLYEVKSTNYHVLSDIDKKTCKDAAKVLEQAFTAYRVNFGWVSRDRSRRFVVYLFSGRRGFMKYQEDIQQLMGRPAEHAAGLYSPLLKQLLIWNLPSREEMLATIRHEGFHQYLDRFMPDPPTWFNEGLAVYHEDGELERGRLVFGQIQREYVELLRENDLVPLEKFLFAPHAQFYKRGHASYAQAWAFVHMLQHGKAHHRKLFKAMVERFQSEDPPHEALKKLLPPAALKQLDKELAAYVATLDD